MRKKNFEKKMENAVYVIELIISIVILIGILVGIIDLVRYFIMILKAPPIEAYDIFHTFLGHCLLLLVGAEFIYMIIHHSIKSLLELILFVIARKMLIYSHTMMDLVFGTIALAIVFLIIKFLIPMEKTRFFNDFESTSLMDAWRKRGIKDNTVDTTQTKIEIDDSNNKPNDSNDKPEDSNDKP